MTVREPILLLLLLLLLLSLRITIERTFYAEAGHAWLLEVNARPALAGKEEELKARVVESVLLEFILKGQFVSCVQDTRMTSWSPLECDSLT